MGKTFNTGTLVNGVTVLSNGNVGIGTSSPYLRFDVRGGAIGQTTTDFATGSTGTVVYMRTGATTGNTTFGLIQVGNNGDNTGGNLVLNQFGGNVGIGTSNPITNLHINHLLMFLISVYYPFYIISSLQYFQLHINL